ncbi:hypothetical protein PHMEG_00041819, partial [Phytophthora megakarya]
MDLLPGESRGYWKHHSPGKWFRQAKITGQIHNEKAILLLNTGAEVSIVDTAFARKVGCYIDSSQIQDCVGIGDNVYQTEGRTRIKVTLAGSLVYFFDIWLYSIGSRHYMEWQNLALEATTDIRSEETEGKNSLVPAVERPEYETPRAILQRPKATLIQRRKVKASQDLGIPDCPPSDESPPDKSPSDKSPSEMRPLDIVGRE